MKPEMNRLSCLGGIFVGCLVLAGCESSTRLGSFLPEMGSSQRGASLPANPPPPLTAAPTGDVESSSLPPPAASPGMTGLPSAPAPGLNTSVATAPGNLPPAPPPALNAAPSIAAPAPAPSRTGLTGNWALTESAGNRCRITLSSAPKLDLYGAGTNGCQTKELQRVNAWELNGSEVILYEPGGSVAARLRQAGAGTYTGVSTKSGAPISLTK